MKGVAVLENGVGGGLGWGGWGVALFSIHGMSYGVARVAGVASLVGPWIRKRSNSNFKGPKEVTVTLRVQIQFEKSKSYSMGPPTHP